LRTLYRWTQPASFRPFRNAAAWRRQAPDDRPLPEEQCGAGGQKTARRARLGKLLFGSDAVDKVARATEARAGLIAAAT